MSELEWVVQWVWLTVASPRAILFLSVLPLLVSFSFKDTSYTQHNKHTQH